MFHKMGVDIPLLRESDTMDKKRTARDTTELLHDLKSTKNMADYFEKNQSALDTRSLPERLHTLLKQKNLSKKEVIRASGLEVTYAYHIFSGKKRPLRPKLLALALAMQLDLEETQHLLNSAELPQLYARIPWDSLLIYAVEHHKTVIEANLLLSDFHESPLLE